MTLGNTKTLRFLLYEHEILVANSMMFFLDQSLLS